MKKLFFVCSWNKRKELTWSGICWGLYKSLKKYYDIQDVDISNVRAPLYKRIFKKLLGRKDLGYSDVIAQKRYLEGNGIQKGVCFQFTDIVENSSCVETYMFQDCSSAAVLDIRMNNLVARDFCFSSCSIAAIKKRADLEMRYLNSCSGIFTLCRWLANDYVNRLGVPREKVHYVGSGVNVDVDKIDGTNRKGKKVLFVGKDFKRKGGFAVVAGYKKLKELMPDAELYVAGPSEDPIKEDIEGYHFMGLCERSQLNELYNTCDVFALPSYFEAFGIVIAEALVFGLPCLVRNVFDMPYVVEHNVTGWVISEDNPSDIGNALFELLNDKKYRDNVNARRDFYLKEYSWDTVAKRIHEVIN